MSPIIDACMQNVGFINVQRYTNLQNSLWYTILGHFVKFMFMAALLIISDSTFVNA